MIIPVLDLKNGHAVSGKSGKRDTYTQLKTVYHHSSNPEKIAHALRNSGAERIYIADLDAIEGKGFNRDVIRRVNNIIPVMLDCGAHNLESTLKGLEISSKVIVATETIESPQELKKILGKVPEERLVISVDLKDGEILSKSGLGCNEMVKILDENTPQEIILLDISRVGTFKGINELFISKFKKLRTSIIIGGGMSGGDVGAAYDLGVDKILVGSALHSGKLKIQPLKN
jgi:phosphoribosylformimino-5-aminoimidazole carboxamide ribotide isomerase